LNLHLKSFFIREIQAGAGNLDSCYKKIADELNEILKLTGNVAAVTGLDFRTTAEQIQRSFSSGIGSADLFRERGVRALLGFKAGVEVTTEETKKDLENYLERVENLKKQQKFYQLHLQVLYQCYLINYLSLD